MGAVVRSTLNLRLRPSRLGPSDVLLLIGATPSSITTTPGATSHFASSLEVPDSSTPPSTDSRTLLN